MVETGDTRSARSQILDALQASQATGDLLTAFVLRLWQARLESSSGREAAARSSLSAALEIGRACGFRLSPNWWSPVLLQDADLLVDARDRGYLRSLWVPHDHEGAPQRSREVRISATGDISVGGVTAADDLWRTGRTGAGVLKRYFRTLWRAHPSPLTRDQLADLLWPESEGDRAVRNLYAATHDLRLVLSSVPGVSLVTSESRYRLSLRANVLSAS
jgi:hypothetical protein